jgi:hypothetical protein
LINDKGEVIDSLPPLLDGYVIADIPLSDNAASSQILSTAFFVLCSAILLTAAVGGMYGNLIKKRQ